MTANEMIVLMQLQEAGKAVQNKDLEQVSVDKIFIHLDLGQESYYSERNVIIDHLIDAGLIEMNNHKNCCWLTDKGTFYCDYVLGSPIPKVSKSFTIPSRAETRAIN